VASNDKLGAKMTNGGCWDVRGNYVIRYSAIGGDIEPVQRLRGIMCLVWLLVERALLLRLPMNINESRSGVLPLGMRSKRCGGIVVIVTMMMMMAGVDL
jgi:hypothetical protein